MCRESVQKVYQKSTKDVSNSTKKNCTQSPGKVHKKVYLKFTKSVGKLYQNCTK